MTLLLICELKKYSPYSCTAERASTFTVAITLYYTFKEARLHIKTEIQINHQSHSCVLQQILHY